MKIRRKRQGRAAVGRVPSAKGPTVRETALAARVADLEAELRARDDFLAIAAHELRNPMTPISARLELLLARARQMSGGVPAGLVHDLELLEGLVNAYLRRATTLLEVARASCGKLNLQTAEVDLSALVRQVTANMLPYSARKKIDQRKPLYSVWKPATNSLSASARSNGARLQLAVAVMKKIKNAANVNGSWKMFQFQNHPTC